MEKMLEKIAVEGQKLGLKINKEKTKILRFWKKPVSSSVKNRRPLFSRSRKF